MTCRAARPALATLALATLALAACADASEPTPAADTAGSTSTATDPAPAPTTTSTEANPTDPATTGAASTTADPGRRSTAPAPPVTTAVAEPSVGEPVVALAEVARFERPVDLVARADDPALYVVEQGGRVVRWDGAPTVVADVGDRISGANEQGLLGLEFSPDGALAYLDYTARDGTTVIAEYPVAADGTLDVGAERVVLTVEQPYANHNAGDLAFGPDGMLYVTLGDGGSGGDPERHGSDPTTLLGSLLRIDPTPSGDAAYTIPPDNPFAAGPVDGVAGAPEVWAWGLRNPWKIAFDPVTGALWIADVGQNSYEEINVVLPAEGLPAGRRADFGWSAFEGDARFNTDVPDTGGAVSPVLTYRHSDGGCSISGGAPYRGTAIAELAPAFVYGDFCLGAIWAFDVATGANLTLAEGIPAISAVRVGPDGELYVLSLDGPVHRLVPG